MSWLGTLGSIASGTVTFFKAATYLTAIVSAVKFFNWDKSKDPVMDTGIFDQIVAQFQGICLGAANNGHGLMENTGVYAAGLFHYLILFDFIIAVILGLLAFESGPNFITLFANKIFKYGFWTWIMMNWQEYTARIINSFEKIGNFSGSSTYISNKPSLIADLGWTYAGSYLKQALGSIGEKMEIDAAVIFVITLLVALVIFLSFFVMAINLVVTKVEFLISSSLMLIFIPFALFDKTERFASQVFNLVISCGVRLMVLSALCSIAHEFYDPQSASGAGIKAIYTFKDTPGIVNAFMAMGLSAMFGYLCCEIPQVASGIISGSLQLNSNSAFLHAAGATAAIKEGISTAAKMAAPGVSGVAAATKAGVQALKNGSTGKGAALEAAAGFGKGVSGAIGDAVTNKFDTPFTMYNAGQAAAGFAPPKDGDPANAAANNVVSGDKTVKGDKGDKGDKGRDSNSGNDNSKYNFPFISGDKSSGGNLGIGNFNKPMS